jgi:hypothetical protein
MADNRLHRGAVAQVQVPVVGAPQGQSHRSGFQLFSIDFPTLLPQLPATFILT